VTFQGEQGASGFQNAREKNESLAMTTARAMGISGQQLRAALQQRAFGGPR
jgi:hypothetical protein